MAIEVILPKLGLTMEEGTISGWLVNEGQTVKKGEPLLAIETDKVTIDVEAPATGILLKILRPEGSIVPVAQVIGYIGEPGEEIPSGEIVDPQKIPFQETTASSQTSPLTTKHERDFVPISPIARKLALTNNVDISKIVGSGPGGRIIEKDIHAAIQDTETTEGILPVKHATLTPLQKTMAHRMVQSFQNIPHFYLRRDLMITDLYNRWRGLQPQYKKEFHLHLTITDFLIKAIADILDSHPRINASWDQDTILLFGTVNIGLAVSTEKGLIVPVIRDVQKKGLMEITKERIQLSEKARANQLSQMDVSDATFTLSNLGMMGIDEFSPIINPPQCAILAVGKISDKPVGEDGQIVLRPMVTITLAADHRIIDGAQGAVFLDDLARLLSKEPEKI